MDLLILYYLYYFCEPLSFTQQTPQKKREKQIFIKIYENSYLMKSNN